ncbi:hypothetical protein N0V93_007952 [Gnomoniopsis smithogilvyi]|uniref:D-arabinono-1,4-lactone oxidase n=1 Tax=Gnomoniopsis smithogilvyi TaxID=1191159 RepID=A0A9W9CTF7_9PEZI|nr:hypothetical protein N0V93_007952 [Gnomoniopsis smithogilvyi]
MEVGTIGSVLRDIAHHAFDTSAFPFLGRSDNHRRSVSINEVPQIETEIRISPRQDPLSTGIRLADGALTFDATQPGPDQWANWLNEEVCTPISMTKPKDLTELVSIITTAGTQGQRVRAVGAGHSMSDVARTDDAVLVYTDLFNAVTHVDTSTLSALGSSLNIMHVQSGIHIKDLNEELDNRGLALTHMGAYDGQTISGAFSTGTHGSGAAWGPMASMIRAIVLVAENGTVYQIEPTNGITDAAKFPGFLPEAPNVPIVLKQDNDWFNAAQVSMGSLGIIYSYVMDVTPAFNIAENRTSVRWENVKGQFAPELWNPLPAPLAEFDHFELVISPYADSDGTHTLIWTERKRVGQTPPRGARQDFFGKILENLGILFTSTLPDILNVVPSLVPSTINTALDNLVDDDAPYIDKSFIVYKALDSDLELKAHGLELHFPAQNLVATIDTILNAFKNAAEQRNLYIAGPIGIRFTAPSEALLAPESGRLTATAELDNIVGIEEGVELLQQVKAEITGADRSIRVHWGLELETTTAQDVRDWYGPNLDKWLAVYKQLNPNGMFNNKFTDRVGFSTTPA